MQLVPRRDRQGALASWLTSPEHLWFQSLPALEFLISDYRLSCYIFIRLVFILFTELKQVADSAELRAHRESPRP